MTIEFWKNRKKAVKDRESLARVVPQVKRKLRIAKVQVINSKLANDWGIRRMTPKGGNVKKDEIGYIYAFPGMKKAFKKVK